MIADPHIAITCHICHKPVQLEKAVSDEKGKTVHPECYARVISLDLHDADPLIGPRDRHWVCQI